MTNAALGTYAPVSGSRLTIAGEATDPVKGVCPAGYDFYDENQNGGAPDPGECKRTGLVVGANGNVGIGTTSPSQKLEVAGNLKTDDACLNSDPTLCLSKAFVPGSAAWGGMYTTRTGGECFVGNPVLGGSSPPCACPAGFTGGQVWSGWLGNFAGGVSYACYKKINGDLRHR